MIEYFMSILFLFYCVMFLLIAKSKSKPLTKHAKTGVWSDTFGSLKKVEYLKFDHVIFLNSSRKTTATKP